ncbi:MAG: phage shock protein PspA [Gammaproteobacteria bacterium]|nr:phage shock protein PspA [Gammaproteobacteria bacterium]MDE0252917.1 phage shock protein PspA [Gammaproteobacteria bacterium]MDE0402070.1 phage shock protein PspA [Gammaproteobacteria bacterium]MDE0645757.1 phage shock protein PspA [Gammaproteobacteria bacterium]
MGIFSRVSDIVNSNLNAMLDKAENPEKMVRLIIQEMEETLVEVRTSAARGLADKKELERRRGVFQHEATEWRQKAEIAVKRDRDDLAKGALIEAKKAAEMVDALSKDLDNIETMLVKMNDDINTLTQKLKDAKLRQAALVVRGRSAKARLNVRQQLTERNVDEAMIRFEKYERKIDDLEGAVESYDMGQRNLADEISELEADEQIENELQDLKRSLSDKAES